MTNVLDGKKLAEKLKLRLGSDIKKSGLRPGLASILVGGDPASALYISIKERAAREVGIYFKKYYFANSKNHKKSKIKNLELRIIKTIKQLNSDKKIHGILVQLPLPKSFDTNKIISTIDPKKDVDGFHPENIGLIKSGKPRFISPPHGAILALIEKSGIKKASALIIANSETFAEPLKWLLDGVGFNTRIIYNRLSSKIKKADLIVVARGKAKLITAPMVKNSAVLIDVGTNRVNGKLVGDIDFGPVSKKASFITPVPGGVGPMSVAMLLKNVFLSAKQFSDL